MLSKNLGLVLLYVTNPQKSAHFYQELLEIDPLEESPTFVMFRLANGVMLGLWSKYTAEPRPESAAGAMDLCFAVENVDAAYENSFSKQWTVIQKPTDMDFGKTFVIVDLDGHRIRIYKLSERCQ